MELPKSHKELLSSILLKLNVLDTLDFSATYYVLDQVEKFCKKNKNTIKDILVNKYQKIEGTYKDDFLQVYHSIKNTVSDPEAIAKIQSLKEQIKQIEEEQINQGNCSSKVVYTVKLVKPKAPPKAKKINQEVIEDKTNTVNFDKFFT